MLTLTSSIHNHNTLCDGKSTAREMAEGAVAAGLTDFGFSSHSPQPFDPSYGLKDEKLYIDTINALKEDYRGKLNVWLGVERDFCTKLDYPEAYDYIIGAVHYLELDGGYYPVEEPALLPEIIDAKFGGDILSFVECYYNTVAENVERNKMDVIAHFDLITKHSATCNFFDEDDARYRQIAISSLDRCAKSGYIFEVNTGAMYRAAKKNPYPADFLLNRILELNGRVIITADAHDCRHVNFNFDVATERLKKLGFTAVEQYIDGKFKTFKL